jgi:hypothetical protein
MKHYQSPTGELFAFEEDGSQDHLIWKNFVALSEEEVKVLRKAQQEKWHQEWLASQPSKAEQIAKLQAQIDALKA